MRNRRYAFSLIALIIYAAVLIKVMVFKDVPTLHIGILKLDFSGTDGGNPANFVPFKTIGPYLIGDKGWLIAGINLVGNIIFLIPVGLLVPLVFTRINWKRSLATALASGLMIETLQEILGVGIFDIDDVILNAFGLVVGYWAFVIFGAWIHAKQYLRIATAIILIIAIAAGAIYAVYPRGKHVTPPAPENTGTQADLCNGTGGTGEILTVVNHAITIKRKDGLVQTLKLTSQTTIKTPAGVATEADLKVGEHVTLVVLDEETASTVLVCS